MTTSTSQALPIQDSSLAHLLYGLMTGFPLLLVPVLLSLSINLAQGREQMNELLATHLNWQRFSIIGLLAMLTIAYFIPPFWPSISLGIAALVWFSLRLVKGWLSLVDGRAM